MDKFDTEAIKAANDCRDLAAQHTTLRPWSAGELAGPCPKCGGTDRFHVKQDWAYCNVCWPADKGTSHDVIAFGMWLWDCDFTSACQRLSNGTPPAAGTTRRQPAKKSKACHTEAWQREAAEDVRRAVAVLDSDAGKPGRDYLEKRGIHRDTWEAFGVGYSPAVWHSNWKRKAGAVAIPWLECDKYTAIKYRFPEAGDKADRFRHKSGGDPGLCGLPLAGDLLDTLILVEGEVNAMSIWQVVRDLGRRDVDVVSFGSESGAIHEQALTLAKQYRRVIVWADKADRARQAIQSIGEHAHGLQSPENLDANDLLQAGLLAEFVGLALQKFAPPALNYKVTLILPGDTPLGLPAGNWHKLRSGEIKATYTRHELETALFVGRARPGQVG